MLSPQVLPPRCGLRHLSSVLNRRQACGCGLRVPSRIEARVLPHGPEAQSYLTLLLTLPATPASCGSLSTFGPVLLPAPLSPGSCLTSCPACGWLQESPPGSPLPILRTTAVCPPRLPRAWTLVLFHVGTASWPWSQVPGEVPRDGRGVRCLPGAHGCVPVPELGCP